MGREKERGGRSGVGVRESVCHVTYIIPLHLAGKLNGYIGHVMSGHLMSNFPSKFSGENLFSVYRLRDANVSPKFSG